MMSYGGVFTSDFRRKLQAQWMQHIEAKGIDIEKHTNLVEFMGKPVSIQQWTVVGLPKDENSI